MKKVVAYIKDYYSYVEVTYQQHLHKLWSWCKVLASLSRSLGSQRYLKAMLIGSPVCCRCFYMLHNLKSGLVQLDGLFHQTTYYIFRVVALVHPCCRWCLDKREGHGSLKKLVHILGSYVSKPYTYRSRMTVNQNAFTTC